MFTFNIDPVLLSIGPLDIRYYGLIYVLGFVIAYFFIRKLSKERNLNLSKDDIEEFMLYGILATVIGARLFYILFYNLPFYIENPLQVFSVWLGGLSFHGSFVGIALVAFWFCRKHKISFYQLADILVIPAALALAFGRIGNFLNGELVGRVTSLPWGVDFPGYEGFRHPSQLYESAKNFLTFGVLMFERNKGFRDGYLFWVFVFMYGTLRFLIEFARAPDPQLGFIGFGLTMGQLLTIPMAIVGGYMALKFRKKV